MAHKRWLWFGKCPVCGEPVHQVREREAELDQFLSFGDAYRVFNVSRGGLSEAIREGRIAQVFCGRGYNLRVSDLDRMYARRHVQA